MTLGDGFGWTAEVLTPTLEGQWRYIENMTKQESKSK